MKHTAGPWEARNGEVTTQRENGRSYRRIAAVQDYGMGSQPDVDDANARLIAAAPDLLAALATLVNLNEGSADGGQGIEADDWDTARAAIAKAQGIV